MEFAYVIRVSKWALDIDIALTLQIRGDQRVLTRIKALMGKGNSVVELVVVVELKANVGQQPKNNLLMKGKEKSRLKSTPAAPAGGLFFCVSKGTRKIAGCFSFRWKYREI